MLVVATLLQASEAFSLPAHDGTCVRNSFGLRQFVRRILRLGNIFAPAPGTGRRSVLRGATAPDCLKTDFIHALGTVASALAATERPQHNERLQEQAKARRRFTI
ncbi:hypothetical protein TSA66_17605 [Noviherbaspirillum autotrophicum]|uniref:Uncharacterized protein n=1 Tax=Noviherbaspirillum autotrophicum TaxID=709839 RepID=A0A0C2BQ38_9BURK|nr:hypothetical protein TSA66_17605 [Noviherbaspirillum autotrophicum]